VLGAPRLRAPREGPRHSLPRSGVDSPPRSGVEWSDDAPCDRRCPRCGQRASSRILKAAFSDLDTYIRFMRVAHMLDDASAMLTPRTLTTIAMGGGGDAKPGEAPRVGSPAPD
jgi:hypothetical protein